MIVVDKEDLEAIVAGTYEPPGRVRSCVLVRVGKSSQTGRRRLWSAGVVAEAAEELHFGVVIPDLSIEAIANLGKGIEAAAAEAGNIEVTVVGTLDIQRMVEAMENFAAQGVDTIIYDTIDAAGHRHGCGGRPTRQGCRSLGRYLGQ